VWALCVRSWVAPGSTTTHACLNPLRGRQNCKPGRRYKIAGETGGDPPGAPGSLRFSLHSRPLQVHPEPRYAGRNHERTGRTGSAGPRLHWPEPGRRACGCAGWWVWGQWRSATNAPQPGSPPSRDQPAHRGHRRPRRITGSPGQPPAHPHPPMTFRRPRAQDGLGTFSPLNGGSKATGFSEYSRMARANCAAWNPST
jgi:hypothetical protein